MSESTQSQNTQISKDLKSLSNKDLALAYQNKGDEQAFKELLRRVEPSIAAGVRNWGGNNPDLKLRARLIAREAIKKYSPEYAESTSPSTWVYNNMPKLSRYRDERTSVVHTPDSVKRDVRYLTMVKNKLKEEDGVEPSVGKLKDYSGLSEKRMEKAMAAFSDTGIKETEKGDILGIPRNNDDKFDSWVHAVYSELDEPGRKVFEGATGYMGAPRKQKQQLAKELNISPSAVTGRLKTIQNRLQEFKEE